MATQAPNNESLERQNPKSSRPAIWKSASPIIRAGARGMKKVARRAHIESAEKLISSTFTIIVRVGLSVVVAGLVYLVYKGFSQNQFTIEKFNVPKVYAEGGFDGVVVAHRVMDEVQEIKEKASSIKQDSLNMNTGDSPEMNVAVMGFGISINSIIYYARDIFGKGNKSIGGEITELDDQLELTLRMTGQKPETFTASLVDSGRSVALKKLFTEAAEKILGHTDPYRLAVYKYREGDHKEAIKVARNMVLYQREPEWGFLAWGSVLEEQKQYNEALDKFKQSIEIEPSFSLGHYRVAQNMVQHQLKVKEAIPYYEKALELEPGRSEWWNTLAWVYHADSSYDQCDYAFEKAIETGPENHYLWGNWGNALLQRGDTLGGIKKLKVNYTKDPRGINGIFTLASTFILQGEIDSAKVFLNRALEIAPKDANVTNQVASYFYYMKLYDYADDYFNKAIAYAKNEKNDNLLQRALNVKAMTKYSIQEFDSALYYVKLSIDIDPDIAYTYTTLAETYAYMENEDQNFYEACKMAVARGFNFSRYRNEEPYNRYKDDPIFLEIISAKK